MTTLLGVAVLVASGVALAAASLIVVPAPTNRLWWVGILAAGYSLVVAGAAVVLISGAAVTIALGAVVLGGVAACLAVVTLALALVPAVEGRRAARTQGVQLSPRAYWSRPAWTGPGSTETIVFSYPPDVPDGLALDVWSPADPEHEPGSTARAGVLLVHGGGWTSGGRGGIPRWNEWLADHGWVVFDVDYRLAPPPRWEDAATDVADAIAWVRAHAARFRVDPLRIGLIGWSAGGHLALLSAYGAAGADQRVAAVAAFYPITDLRTAAQGCRPRWAEEAALSQVNAFLGGPVVDHADAARIASPVVHVDDAVPPTFLVHGTSDQLVPVTQSDALVAALSQGGADHELVRLRGANHAFDLAWGAWSTQVTRAALGRFLDRHLGTPCA
jgi:acetyl esterase/lipase